MKKTIFLKVEYLDLKNKKSTPAEEQKLREALLKKSVKLFKEQMRIHLENKELSILKEVFPSQVVIEYENDEVFRALIQAEVVEVIDSQVY